MSKNSEIKFEIGLDENHVPETISWEASDNGEKGQCDVTMLTMWDKNEKNTLRIDLWTKDMIVDDMKLFFYQQMLTMSDTFERSTGETQMAKEMRDFAQGFGEKMQLIKPI